MCNICEDYIRNATTEEEYIAVGILMNKLEAIVESFETMESVKKERMQND